MDGKATLSSDIAVSEPANESDPGWLLLAAQPKSVLGETETELDSPTDSLIDVEDDDMLGYDIFEIGRSAGAASPRLGRFRNGLPIFEKTCVFVELEVAGVRIGTDGRDIDLIRLRWPVVDATEAEAEGFSGVLWVSLVSGRRGNTDS